MSRKISVELVGDDRSLQQAFKRSSRGAKNFDHDIGRASRGALAASVSFKGLGRSMAFASSQFLGGAGLVFAFKQVINESSRVQEETEKTGVLFGKSAVAVQDWSKTLAESFGVSEGAALQATGRFGNMLRPLGFGQQAAAKMSERLVTLAADMASFNNIKPEQALDALTSGLSGQVKPLRTLGVFLSASRIKEEALADGITKNANKLTQAQKVQAAYNIILKDTRLQQGDVARNTGSLSVAMSKLTAGVQNTETGLGNALLPTVTQYVNKAGAWLNQTKNQERIQRDVNKVLHDATSVFKAVTSLVNHLSHAMGGLERVGELLIGLKLASKLQGWSTAFGRAGGAAAVANGKVATLRGSLLGLSELTIAPIVIPIIVKYDNKLRGGSGAKGVLGKIASDFAVPSQFVGDAIRLLQKDAADVNAKGIDRGGRGPAAAGGAAAEAGAKAAAGAARVAAASSGSSGSSSAGGGAGLDRLSSIQNAVSSARLGVSRGDAGAKQQLVAALKAQIDYDRKYEGVQAGLIRRRVGDVKKHAQTLQRLQADEAGALDEINGMTAKATAAVKKKAKNKSATAALGFAVPVSLLIAQAKASASASDKDDRKVASQIKRFTEKMIRSGKLRGQALIDAWDEIANQNSVLANNATQSVKRTNHSVAVSTAKLTAGLHLGSAVRKELEARFAQAEAHGGHVPTGHAVGGVTIHTLNVTANNADHLIDQIQKKARHAAVQTRGPNAGRNPRVH